MSEQIMRINDFVFETPMLDTLEQSGVMWANIQWPSLLSPVHHETRDDGKSWLPKIGISVAHWAPMLGREVSCEGLVASSPRYGRGVAYVVTPRLSWVPQHPLRSDHDAHSVVVAVTYWASRICGWVCVKISELPVLDRQSCRQHIIPGCDTTQY